MGGKQSSKAALRASHAIGALPLCCLAISLQEVEASSFSRASARVGTGFDFRSVDDLRAMQHISWWYDWGREPAEAAFNFSLGLGIEYVPMQWANWGIEDLLCSSHLELAEHLLGFNEPNHREQANLTPEEAAGLWHYMEEASKRYGLRLGSPSPAACGIHCITKSPFKWWDEFFEACVGCQIDFLAVHIYTCNGDAAAWFLRDCRKYGLPIWVTEFACPIGPGPEHEISQELFMTSAIHHMQADPLVERFAWFAPRVYDGWVGESASLLQLHQPELSRLGKHYLQIASKNRLLDGGQSELMRGIPLENRATDDQELWSWSEQCDACFGNGVIERCHSWSLPSDRNEPVCTHCMYTCGVLPRKKI